MVRRWVFSVVYWFTAPRCVSPTVEKLWFLAGPQRPRRLEFQSRPIVSFFKSLGLQGRVLLAAVLPLFSVVPQWVRLPAGPLLLHKSRTRSRPDVRPLSLRSTVEIPPLHRSPSPRSQQRPKGLGIVPLLIWV
ncbi:hypothetical protein NDU88_000294 [Pleurodeles waltl]|uniref:Secreted protein n=1 Tax=Pleurodeles waltl TaxID=8319 RepID=A0AAV7R6E2_PLEWA|nr:hypothetical protein NDU88_000294 [Pleurodeles waltl]